MAHRRKIEGFLHYRTDLGDGVRTGVAFSSCTLSSDEIRTYRKAFFSRSVPLYWFCKTDSKTVAF